MAGAALRPTSDSIGLSGHKNEYTTGVRIGNWVEEQFGAEAQDNTIPSIRVREIFPNACHVDLRDLPPSLVLPVEARACLERWALCVLLQFINEEAQAPKPGGKAVVEIKRDEPAHMIFSHGPNPNERFNASMNNLHYTHPGEL
eukprot:1082527-Pleurochrysis_carterae.AAC.6